MKAFLSFNLLPLVVLCQLQAQSPMPPISATSPQWQRAVNGNPVDQNYPKWGADTVVKGGLGVDTSGNVYSAGCGDVDPGSTMGFARIIKRGFNAAPYVVSDYGPGFGSDQAYSGLVINGTVGFAVGTMADPAINDGAPICFVTKFNTSDLAVTAVHKIVPGVSGIPLDMGALYGGQISVSGTNVLCSFASTDGRLGAVCLTQAALARGTWAASGIYPVGARWSNALGNLTIPQHLADYGIYTPHAGAGIMQSLASSLFVAATLDYANVGIVRISASTGAITSQDLFASDGITFFPELHGMAALTNDCYLVGSTFGSGSGFLAVLTPSTSGPAHMVHRSGSPFDLGEGGTNPNLGLTEGNAVVVKAINASTVNLVVGGRGLLTSSTIEPDSVAATLWSFSHPVVSTGALTLTAGPVSASDSVYMPGSVTDIVLGPTAATQTIYCGGYQTTLSTAIGDPSEIHEMNDVTVWKNLLSTLTPAAPITSWGVGHQTGVDVIYSAAPSGAARVYCEAMGANDLGADFINRVGQTAVQP